MALSIPTYTSASTGLALTNAYAILGRSHGDLTNFIFDIDFYVSAGAYTSGLNPIFSRSFSIPTTDITGIPYIYTYLQTLPEFSGSTVV